MDELYDNYRIWVRSRILAHSVRRENGCIEYGGDRPLKHKYGLISLTVGVKRKSVPAHRALWMAVHNRFDLPTSVYIRHTCGNPRCVNIEHLEAGAHADNMRGWRPAGQIKAHVRERVISNDVIREILAEPPGMRNKQVAEKYGISYGYASKLRSGKAKAPLRAEISAYRRPVAPGALLKFGYGVES